MHALDVCAAEKTLLALEWFKIIKIHKKESMSGMQMRMSYRIPGFWNFGTGSRYPTLHAQYFQNARNTCLQLTRKCNHSYRWFLKKHLRAALKSHAIRDATANEMNGIANGLLQVLQTTATLK